MKKKILWIIDPLDSLAYYKDSTVAMMRVAAFLGHEVFAATLDSLSFELQRVAICAAQLSLNDNINEPRWYEVLETVCLPLTEFTCVLMRKDPPFNMEYVWALMLLEQAEKEGARIFNAPGAIKSHGEKLAILEFYECIPPTTVSRQSDVLQSFIEKYADVIIKPLDGMGGSGIFRIRSNDPNRNAIIETVTDYGREWAMVQVYLPAISEGDKRILLINGKPIPYALARIPKDGESRGNLAAGGRGVAMPLSDRERFLAEKLGPVLVSRGLFLVGLDVIGGFVTEINVTSPTCFVEITQQTGFNVAAHFIEELEMTLC